jgi:hypothetical protein
MATQYMGQVHYKAVEPQPQLSDRHFIIERREETIQGAEKGVYNHFLFPSIGAAGAEDFFKKIGFSNGRSAVLGLAAIEFFLFGLIGMAEAEVKKRKGLLAQLAQQISTEAKLDGDVSEATLSKPDLRVLKLAQVVSRGMDIHREDAVCYRELVGELEAARFGFEMRTSPLETEKRVYDELFDKVGAVAIARSDAHLQFHEQSRAFNQKVDAWFWDPAHKVPEALLPVKP